MILMIQDVNQQMAMDIFLMTYWEKLILLLNVGMVD